MGFSLLDRISGVANAWLDHGVTSDKGGSLAVSGDDETYLGNPALAVTPVNGSVIQHGRFGNSLSYDPALDEIIWVNGEMRRTPGSSTQVQIDAGLRNYTDFLPTDAFTTAKNSVITYTRVSANSLDPALSPTADSEPGLVINGRSFYTWVTSGAANGFTYDHQNGFLYAYHGSRIALQRRTNSEYDQDYGNPSFYTLFDRESFIGRSRWFTAFAGEDTATPTMLAQMDFLLFALGANKPWPIKPAGQKFMVPPVVMNDVVAHAFSHGGFGGVMITNQRGEPATWIGSHPIDQAAFLGMFPLGIDRFMTIGFMGAAGLNSIGSGDTPLVAMTYRYNRGNNQLTIDDISLVPTQYKYTWPDHVGFMTFDTKRQALILMDPTFETFERHVFSILCHPLSPNKIATPAPITPIHAGQTSKWITATYDDVMPIAAPFVELQFGGSATTVAGETFKGTDAGFRTDGTTGTGTFKSTFTSGACGTSFTITGVFSGWSTTLSATLDVGEKFGADAVSLQSTSAAFLVSATLSAASPTTVFTTATITAKRPIKDNDAGGGTPRELDHPVSGVYASPLVYELNPQIWTGQLDEALTKPLYATTRTLEKTATVQHSKDITDIEVKEIWMGGGNRIAMSLAQFTSIYDMFNNPPNIQDQGFILWRPRDVSNKVYKVLMTNLTVGGNVNFQMDHLSRQGDGWIHEQVELTMRIVEEVV
jgi:hypothetical protein